MNKMELIDAATSVELGVADKVIDELRERLTDRKADTHAGYEMVRAGIAEVTKYRTGVDKAGKELKAGALAYQKKVNAEVNRVKGLLLEIETPLREEKARIDDEAERQRIENEALERLAIEAQELAEKQAREAEEAAKREAERKEREAENARLEEQRKALEADRKKLEAEQRVQQEALEKERQELADEREAIEADRRAEYQKALREQEAKEALALVKQEQADRQLAAEEEEVRLAEEKAEQERLAEERKPDQKKLQDFGDRIQELESPDLKTPWGRAIMAIVCNHLQRAVDSAYYDSKTQDDLAATDASETVSEQSPSS